MQSVGRVYFNLTKPEPSRWRGLVPPKNKKKFSNLGVWWELWEKYERELVEFEPWEDEDDEELLKKYNKKK